MLSLKNLTAVYNKKLVAVNNVSLNLSKGEFVGVIGLSGSGKSTLLKTVNLLVKPQYGKVIFDGVDITNFHGASLRKVRREIGLIFQDYNLIDRSSVLANVLVGRLGFKSSFQSFFGIYSDDDYKLAIAALEEVGLKDKIFVRADQLSGGQKQRVAIAKTLCQRPKLILADEPVSNLDVKSAEMVMNYFKAINQNQGITIMINLHDVNLAKKYCDRIVALSNGRLIFDGKAGEIDDGLLQKIYQQGEG